MRKGTAARAYKLRVSGFLSLLQGEEELFGECGVIFGNVLRLAFWAAVVVEF